MLARIKSKGKMIAVLPYSQMPDCNDAYIEAMGSRIFYASDLDFDIPETRKETKENANTFAFGSQNALESAHSETAVLEGWVARNKSNRLQFYPYLPRRANRTDEWVIDCVTPSPVSFKKLGLSDSLFPSVTWQSEPKKVKITIEIEEIEE